MAIPILNHEDSYEWIGNFWFPTDAQGQDNEKYVGKISYTPEQGIKVQLSHPKPKFDIFEQGHIAKKLMYGVVTGEGSFSVTLTDIFLGNYSVGGPLTVFRGSASSLIAGVHISNDDIVKLDLRYEERFENIFFMPSNKEAAAFQLSKENPAKLGKFDINIAWRSKGNFLSSVDDLDTVFHCHDETIMKDIKKVMAPFFDIPNSFLTRRSDFVITTRLESKVDLSLDEFIKGESLWRSFWEAMIDHPISIKNVWVYVTCTYPDKTRVEAFPLLNSNYTPGPSSSQARLLPHLPINLYSFRNAKNDLSSLSNSLKKWEEIKTSPLWKPISQEIYRILLSNREIADSTKYVSLVSNIETLLDLLSHTETTPDELIKAYATTEWLKGMKEISGKLPPDESLGKWIKEIRNVITHPKTSNKSNGKYSKVAFHNFKMPQVYAYVAGLFIKAILLHLNDIEPDSIDKYVDAFIKKRAGFSPIIFG